MPLSLEQIQIIRATAPVLKEHGNTITTLFYGTLLAENPSLNNIFNQANQRNNHQAGALAGSLYAYASYIDDLGALSPAVEKICHKHVSLYIKPEHYEVVAKYLLRAMGEVLGDALTPDVLAAWTEAYWQLANLMISREADLYSHAEGWTDWRDFRIVKKVPESSEITSFYLYPVDERPLPPFLPGQYISLQTNVPQFKYLQSRQYSLSDAPRSDYYRISVKKEPGVSEAHPGFISNILHADKQSGDVVQLSHPAGEFFCDVDNSTGPVVLISAGVGLTPLVSILNTLVAKKQAARGISWLHTTRSTEVQAFASHIRDVVKAHESDVSAVVFNKAPGEGAIEGVDYKYKTRMTLDVLDDERDLKLGDKTTNYYICGPDSFMADMKAKLKSRGVEEDRIHMELFGTGMGKA